MIDNSPHILLLRLSISIITSHIATSHTNHHISHIITARTFIGSGIDQDFIFVLDDFEKFGSRGKRWQYRTIIIIVQIVFVVATVDVFGVHIPKNVCPGIDLWRHEHFEFHFLTKYFGGHVYDFCTVQDYDHRNIFDHHVEASIFVDEMESSICTHVGRIVV